ncbi:prolyl oligopeptidase family serine peptidase [Pelagicoccus sp. SDUM812003]|uniref:alpha/beta hydrolase family protein n=1 Tax=Pelagicoccus sp. SDUM812003 TaxID=3041267 RepID=UPI00280E9AD1|nr:prolyl oligopeptidase family serine peptidase [Pelagicoccus sp. SDUM812003]MDQ8201932.1 prolyl oligopeptidase family serine peptidase [Pelagicoccus sp. SDUM812003]
MYELRLPKLGLLLASACVLTASVFADSTRFLIQPVFSEVSLSPSGKYIVSFEDSSEENRRIQIISTADMKSEPLSVSNGKGGNARVTDIRWLTDEYLAIMSEGDDQANWLHTYKLGDRAPERVAKEGKRSILRVIPKSTRFLVLETESPDADGMKRVYEYDATRPTQPKLVYQADSQALEAVADVSGQLRMVKRDDGDGLSWYALATDDHAETKLNKLQQWHKVHGIVKTSDQAIVSGQINTPLPSVYLYDIFEDEPKQVLADQDQYSIDTFGRTVFEPATGEVLGLHFDSTIRTTFWSDPEMQKIQDTVDGKLPGSVNRLIDWNRERTKVMIERFIPMLPTQFIYANLESETYTAVFINGGRVKPGESGVSRLVEIPNRDGQNLTAILTVPAERGGKPSPLLIWIRKGVWTDLDRPEWHPEANYFADSGFVVLRINYSGSEGVLGPLAIDTSTKAGVQQTLEDIEDAAKVLIETGLVDSEKINIGGEGSGAWLAAYAPIHSPGLYQSVVCINGVYDLVDLRKNDKASGGNYLSLASKDSSLSESDLAKLSISSPPDSYPKDVFVAYGKWSENDYKSHVNSFVKTVKKAGAKVKVHLDDWWGTGLEGVQRIKAFERANSMLVQANK